RAWDGVEVRLDAPDRRAGLDVPLAQPLHFVLALVDELLILANARPQPIVFCLESAQCLIPGGRKILRHASLLPCCCPTSAFVRYSSSGVRGRTHPRRKA